MQRSAARNYSRSESFIPKLCHISFCLQRKNKAVKSSIDLRTTHTACWGYSALLHVLRPTGEAGINEALFSPTSASGGTFSLVPKCTGTVFHTVASPKVWLLVQVPGVTQGREFCYYLISSAGCRQSLYSRHENCMANKE